MTTSIPLGPILEPMVLELYILDSFINASCNRNVVNVPWMRIPEMISGNGINIGAVDTSGHQNPSLTQRVEGWVKLQGEGSAVGILETKGDSIKILMARRESLIDRINTAVHQLSQNVKTTKQAISAAAKQEDRKDTEVMLAEYYMDCSKFIDKIMSIILQQLEEDVIPEIKGMNTNDEADRESLIKEAVDSANIPFRTKTFTVNHWYDLATQILGDLSEEKTEELKTELEEEFEKSSANMEEKRQAALQPKTADTANSKPANPASKEQELGPSSLPLAEDTKHLSTGTHVDPQVVYDQLKEDYDEQYIQFVLSIPWEDQQEVPLTSFDFSNMNNWEAIDRKDKIEEFKKLIQENGFAKPIIAVNQLHTNKKLVILDGHTRALSYKELNMPIVSYIGQVGNITKQMTAMQQKTGESGGDRVQSNQNNIPGE
jgi:hypothetical protein